MWSKLTRTANEPDAHVVIPAARVLDPPDPEAAAAFIPHATYFEIRLKQMFLQDRRAYAREFTALSSFNTEFLFGGQRIETPLVVGPSMLANIEIANGDHLEFLNTRLIGPCPYEGDDIELFAGLFRMTTNDWAKQTLGLLELLTKTFDTSKLGSTLNLAKPLAESVESFFGMKDVEYRLGKHLSFAAPGTGGGVQGTLQPAYLALLRTPRSQLDGNELWIRDGRLCHGDDANSLTEFAGCDFMLLHIAPLRSRSDFSSFEFHQNHWRKIEELLAAEKNDEAEQTFRLLAANLVQCNDIVMGHRRALLGQYRAWMDERIEQFAALYGRKLPPADRFRGGERKPSTRGPGLRPSNRLIKRDSKSERPSGPIGEDQLAAAVADAEDSTISPAQLLASVFE